MIQINSQNRDSQTQRMISWFPEGKWGEGIVREFGKVIYILPYSKWITNKDILYSTWNSTQGYVPAWMGGEFGGEWIHAYEFHGQRSQAGYSPWGRKQSDTAE